MIVKVSLMSLRDLKWSDYAVRFVLGGLATVLTGVIGSVAGPEIGGLFLAMPAIFCASATLIERKERDRKKKKGLEGHQRGRDAAALDAAGATLGSAGMIAFALTLWCLVVSAPEAAFVSATIAWVVVSVSSWLLWHRYRRSL